MKIAILCQDCSNLDTQAKATAIAEKLQLPLVYVKNDDFGIYLAVDQEKIGLWIPDVAQKPYFIDFLAGKLVLRQLRQTSQKELIVKACSIKGLGRPVNIIDATAGFGRDAFILAGSGAHVTMLEKNLVVATLLRDALARLKWAAADCAMDLVNEDAIRYLQHMASSLTVDVIYLDPMFEEERRAKVKKDLQLLQALLAYDYTDAKALFDAACRSGAQRVVVKRALHAKAIVDQKPDFTLTGKHTRFDIYRISS